MGGKNDVKLSMYGGMINPDPDINTEPNSAPVDLNHNPAITHTTPIGSSGLDPDPDPYP